jgi:putative ABC transport system permease protein
MTTGDGLLRVSERWFRLLLRLYPPDFRDEMGDALVEAYCDRARDALRSGGIASLGILWLTAVADSLRNGPGERAKPAVAWRRSGNWGRDAELVMRRLSRTPGFVAATVGTLTIGLAMFAVVYATVQKVLIDPMPYRDPDDLYFVWRDYRPALDLQRGALAGTDIVELRKAGGIIESTVALSRFWGGVFSLREGSDPMEIAVTVATPNLFEVLGVAPARGRGFAPNEVGAGRRGVIVLTHELWTRLGADTTLLGTEVRLNGRPYTVIGVMPPKFAFVRHESTAPPQRADAYITFDVNLEQNWAGGGNLSGLIRARAGSPPQEVMAAVEAVGRAVAAREPNGRGLRLYAVGLKADLVSSIRPALLVLGAAGVVLALMLMVNLALVLLARAAQREREITVSRALGASGRAVARATLLEGSMLGGLGGALGAVAAIWGMQAIVALAPIDLPRREAIAMDWRVGGVVVGVGALLGLLAAAAPSAWAARASLSSLLASVAVRGGGGHGRLRRSMIVAQVALSLILLSSGGLVVRSLERLLRADPGFRPEGVLTLRVRMPPELRKPADVVGLQDRIESALAALPGVVGASATSGLPLSAFASQTTVSFPRARGNTGDAAPNGLLVDVIGARAGYVDVMGIQLIAGRDFDRSRRGDAREALIDAHLARTFFPGANPIGASIRFGDGSLTIVGVVRQPRLYDIHQDGWPQIIVRAEDWGFRPLFYVVRTTGSPRALIPDVRAALRQIDRRAAVGDLRTMDEIVADALRPQQTSAVLITGLALGALFLAAMGLFVVISASVTRRRHELAVRMALGADYHRALRLVLREGALLVAIGMLVGLPGIYAAGRLVRAVLVEVSPSDPLTLVVVALGLALVSMAACYVPARRVLRIEPATSLREG